MVELIKRKYILTPFESVKIMEDDNHQYFVSVLSLDKIKYTSLYVVQAIRAF
jgi:hypothetical protein